MEKESYRELRVWKLAMKIAVSCYDVTKSFPKEEAYGMMSQIRRSSAGIAANIAEGYGRGNRNEYIHFLRIAQGSLKELETHLFLSGMVGLAEDADVNTIVADCEDQGRMLGALIRSLLAAE